MGSWPMHFDVSPSVRLLEEELLDFLETRLHPSESIYERQLAELATPHQQPAVMEQLKLEARERKLWNLFLADPEWGAGLTVTEYAPLAALASRSPLGLEAMNCSAPDTGNMELLALFGTPDQQQRWLVPLLNGDIRSCFAMTEPDVASSDPLNLRAMIAEDGDDLVLSGRKWYASGVLDDRCRLVLFVGTTNDKATSPHHRHSIVLVPIESPGIHVLRNLTVFGYVDRIGHGEVVFENVRVPKANLLGEMGEGFSMAQARLGPGRIHYAMRAIGMGERALEMMCRRAMGRVTFGTRLGDRSLVQDWIARSRLELDQARHLVMHAAGVIDAHGNKAARAEVAKVKVAALAAASYVVDRAVQVFGAAGVSDDFVLARMYTSLRALRIADGPDEVHLRTIARHELRQYYPEDIRPESDKRAERGAVGVAP